MPAKAGIQSRPANRWSFKTWIPAFAGMTIYDFILRVVVP